MRLPLRRAARFVLALAALVAASPAWSQTYPAKPVRVIVPYPAGGGADFVTRIVAKTLSENLGQQFFVDNRPGANGNIGADLTAKAPPNGYTVLGVANTTLTINPHLYQQMPHFLGPYGSRLLVERGQFAQMVRIAQSV